MPPRVQSVRERAAAALALGNAGHVDEALSALDEAIDIAQDQGARVLEPRAPTGLARLAAEQSKRRQAHDLLAPVPA